MEHLFVLVLVVLFTAAGTALSDYDRTNPDDVLALNHEMWDDPLGLGYDHLNAGIRSACKLLEDPEKNVGEEVGPLELTPQVVLKAMSFRDYRLSTKDGIPEKDIRRDVRVIMPPLDLFSKTK